MRAHSFTIRLYGYAFLLAVAVILGVGSFRPSSAYACGCFAPPDVATPLVQAGEEILFYVENGQVTMHVRIRYSGRAGEFGWLLPLPNLPTDSQGNPGIEIGTDELFLQLESRTQPTYVLQRNPCNRGGPSLGCGPFALA